MAKTYEAYKDSGVEWIGEIPSHWEVKMIKHVFNNMDYLRQPIAAEQRQKTNPQYDYYGASGVIDKIDYYNVDDTVLLIGEDGANLLMRNLPLIYKASGKIWVNNHAHILKPNVDNYSYLAHLLESVDYTRYITGSAQPKLSQSNLSAVKICIPTLPEQQNIASFIDKKCGEIDSLIALQEEMIRELQAYKQSVITEAVTKGLDHNVKMKDSGVEWIGEIPSHWEVMRFKDFTSLQTMASDNTNKIGLENIEGGTGRFIESDSEFEGNGVAFNIGDVVYGKLRPYLQKVWVATFSGNAVGDFFVFRPKDNCYSQYLFYSMLSDGFTSICNGSTIGAKMPRVSSDFIRSLQYYLPPLPEQAAIASFLDKKCGEIDSLIALQEEMIEELQAYKQSVIYEYVTGKKKV